MWSNRFAWSGEIPLGFPGLNPVALQRITPATGNDYSDSVTTSRAWQRVVGGANDGYLNGPFGLQMSLNSVNPATDQGGFKLNYFSGLWPSSGKLLMGLWSRQRYVMAHSPLMSTRSGSPIAYIATAASGRIRHSVYGTGGTAIFDQYEDHPWVQTLGWQFIGQLLDLTAKTSQMFVVDYNSKQSWLGPVRSFTGTPNTASVADLEVYMLPGSSMWTSGQFDEAVVAHPTSAFSLQDFADNMARGLWSDGQLDANVSAFTVTETEITASSSKTLKTGVEEVSWQFEPVVTGAPTGSTPYWSTDSGATWSTGASLPAPFTGWLRWEVPLSTGQSFSGIQVEEPLTPPPTLAAIPDQALEQGDIVNLPLVWTAQGEPVWAIEAPDMVTASIQGSTLTLAAGFHVGSGPVRVTLTDEIGRSVTRIFNVEVSARTWIDDEPREFPQSPILVWGDDHPEAVIIDAIRAVITTEVNGAEVFDLVIPVNHQHASLIQNERRLSVAGEVYFVRTRVTSRDESGEVLLLVHAEAEFYDLATAAQISARTFTQTSAGEAMTVALEGTGWTVGIANVTTLRTYEVENTNPLELLRRIASSHGGDLLFDSATKKVSLVTQSGRDKGIGFFYGSGLETSRRIVDTSSLVTRIYAQNADGLTIAELNGGKPYLEDFSFTNKVKSATYDFKSGTSAFTMLSMTQATLARRAKPEISYEVSVSDTSARSQSDLDRFEAGDYVTVVDHEVGIAEKQRIVRLEYDVVRPWDTKITLSSKLRELSNGSDEEEAGVLTTGSGVPTFDLVPFNLLLNSRFDNGLAHWANFGAAVVEGNGTGNFAVEFSGSGERWVEQTVAVDHRTSYALSLDVQSLGPAGWSPNLEAEAEITYEDGTTEIIKLTLS